jgi:sterol 3beta-glucosyltransferase
MQCISRIEDDQLQHHHDNQEESSRDHWFLDRFWEVWEYYKSNFLGLQQRTLETKIKEEVPRLKKGEEDLPLTQKLEDSFLLRFPSLADELLIRVFRCQKSVAGKFLPGKIYLTQNHFCFYPVSGFNSIAIPFAYIKKPTFSHNSVRFIIEDEVQEELVFEEILHPRELIALLELPVDNETARKKFQILRRHKSLNITLLTIGTRGDVQPFIALGIALQRVGHRVTLASHEEYEKVALEHDLKFHKVSGNPRELMDFVVRNGMIGVNFLKEGLPKFAALIDSWFHDCWDSCQNADVMVIVPNTLASCHVAEKLKIPFLSAFTMPYTKTASFPHPFLGISSDNAFLNSASYTLWEQSLWLPLHKQINAFRQQYLDLPPLTISDGNALHTSRQVPFAYCWSPSFVPRPHDWPGYTNVCGYWLLNDAINRDLYSPSTDVQPVNLAYEERIQKHAKLNSSSEKWEPPADLVDFIQRSGADAPLYIGFGSIITTPEKATHLSTLVINALRRSGQRAVISSGWCDLFKKKDLPEDIVFLIDTCPHDWLFPQMKAIVHHGGAGTTAAALIAGRPSLAIAFFADQFFWSKRMVETGVGLRIPFSQLKEDNLTNALIKVCFDESMREQAEIIGAQIRKENGVASFIRFMHDYISLYKSQENPHDIFDEDDLLQRKNDF